MKHIAALTALTTLVLTTIAHAQPEAAPNPNAVPPASAVVTFGPTFGSDADRSTMGLALDTSVRVGQVFYGHAQIGGGDASLRNWYERSLSGSYFDAQIGPEVRGCTPGRFGCFYAGADVGVRRFEREVYVDDNQNMTRLDDRTEMVVVPRGGVELGTTFKVKLGIEHRLGTSTDATMVLLGFGFAG